MKQRRSRRINRAREASKLGENDKDTLLISEEIADKVDRSQFEPFTNPPRIEALLCSIEFEGDESADAFIGTLLTYDVDDGVFEITLDFVSISRIMSFYTNGEMTVLTDKEDEVLKVPVRVKRYDLSGPTGVVTLVTDTYRIEVHHG